MIFDIDGEIIDDEIGLLQESLFHLDFKISSVDALIRETVDPDGASLCDRGEHFIGLGFVACQKYLAATYGPAKIQKREALQFGPVFDEAVFTIKIIDATANYWKHSDEWDTIGFLWEIHSEWKTIRPRIKKHLSNQARQTVQSTEIATPWGDYTCSNVLAAVVGDRKCELRSLLPLLVEWRDAFAQRAIFSRGAS